MTYSGLRAADLWLRKILPPIFIHALFVTHYLCVLGQQERMKLPMVLGYLLIGVVFGGLAATLTWVNGGGILLGFAAYSSGGALAVLLILAFHMLFSRLEDDHPHDGAAQDAVSP